MPGGTLRRKLDLGPLSQTSPKSLCLFWDVAIRFKSSQRQGSRPSNFAILLVFHILKNRLKDQLSKTSGFQFDGWHFKPEKSSGLFKKQAPEPVLLLFFLFFCLAMRAVIDKISAAALSYKIQIFFESAVSEQKKSAIISFVCFCRLLFLYLD